MAEGRTIDTVLEEFAGCYGRHPNWVTAARTLWIRMFVSIPDQALKIAARAWMDDPEHDAPPTPARLKAAIEAAVPAERARGCTRCAAGLLELAVHRRIEGENVVTCGIVTCTCEAGMKIRHPRIPTYAGQVEHMERDPTVTNWFERPGPSQRQDLDTPRIVTKSRTLRELRASLEAFARGVDPYASARERAIEAEREREQAW